MKSVFMTASLILVVKFLVELSQAWYLAKKIERSIPFDRRILKIVHDLKSIFKVTEFEKL